MEFFKPLTSGASPVKIPKGGFNLIYADPPWDYKQKVKNGVVSYDTMGLEELKKMPIEGLANADCALAMWITGPLLQEGLDVMKAWGFQFKGVLFCWCKTYAPKTLKDGRTVVKPFFGCGSYSRANCELMILGVRGKKVAAMIKRRSNLGSRGVSQIVITEEDLEIPTPELVAEKYQGHSVKPQIFTDKLNILFGNYVNAAGASVNCHKLELFARTSLTPDWYFFGNEVVKYQGKSKAELESELKREKKLDNIRKKQLRESKKRKRNDGSSGKVR
jgi:N6-adenosine-specific RNA methylase IME4